MLLLFVVGCKSEEDIGALIGSDNTDKIVKGYYLVGINKRTEFIKEAFKDEKDQRISHNLNFYGISVYQSKMISLKKISKLNPPRPITHKYDSLIIVFYKRWAKQNNYIE